MKNSTTRILVYILATLVFFAVGYVATGYYHDYEIKKIQDSSNKPALPVQK